MIELEKTIQYKFKNNLLLELALTHTSYANEHRSKSIKSNERLEFLGDSVLSIVTTDYLYKKFQNLPEGELTKSRAAMVCEAALFEVAKRLKLGEYIRLGKGELATGGNMRASILADATEALIGAIYLDSSLEEAGKFIKRFILKNKNTTEGFVDYKTTLQEIAQKNAEETITYKTVSETGPDHNKVFVVEVLLNSNTIGIGQGSSKKEAEQKAARAALELMGL